MGYQETIKIAGARGALELAAHPTAFLSTVQVGITLVGVLAGAFGGAGISEVLAAQFATVSWLAPYATTIAFALVVAVITYLSLIFGELVPKNIALSNPERVASLVSRPMRAIARVGGPLVRMLTSSTNIVLRVFGLGTVSEPGVTEQDIRAMVEQATESGAVQQVEHEIVENTFRLGDRAVDSIMTPRPDIRWVDLSDDVPAVRAPLYVPATMPVYQLLSTLRSAQQHVAVVLDEYGGVAGLVDMEDVLEGLVGDVPLAADGDVASWLRRADGSWEVEGSVALEEVEERLDLEVEERERAELLTLGGFVMARLGRVPRPGDEFLWSGRKVRVLHMNGRRVERVLIEPPRT